MSKLAYVFPGQGSQAIGMLADLSESHSVVAETFSEASEALGYDLWQLIQDGPEEQLNQTEFTQPALLSASIAIWRVCQEQGLPQPHVVAGHSLGEYSALVAAGSLKFTDAVRLVQQRGQFMQTAVPVGQGGMAAVLGLEDQQVKEICEQASSGSDLVQAANYNAPGQVVIAGSNAALETAIEQLKAAGAKRAMPLAVSAPFHSALMQPAAEKMSEVLESIEIAKPSTAIIQNVDAQYHEDPANIRSNLVAQMFGAVLWTTTMQQMAEDGVETVVECGPGKVLSGLNKRIDKRLASLSINSVDTLAKTTEAFS